MSQATPKSASCSKRKPGCHVGFGASARSFDGFEEDAETEGPPLATAEEKLEESFRPSSRRSLAGFPKSC